MAGLVVTNPGRASRGLESSEKYGKQNSKKKCREERHILLENTNKVNFNERTVSGPEGATFEGIDCREIKLKL